MIEENLLDAVIGLPGNLFPTTNIPVAILVFDRSREKGGNREDCKNVLFVDASREFVSGKNQNTLSEAHIDKVIETCAARAEAEKYAHVAEFAEIKENDFNLNIPRYVDAFEEEEEIDINAVQVEIEAIEKELAEVRGYRWRKNYSRFRGNNGRTIAFSELCEPFRGDARDGSDWFRGLMQKMLTGEWRVKPEILKQYE